MSKLTLDEAIKHCEEQVAKYERQCEYGISKEGKEYNSQCAADHRQLAEWLKELKELRNSVGAVKLKDMKDAVGLLQELNTENDQLTSQLADAKRLLKAAVEDFVRIDEVKLLPENTIRPMLEYTNIIDIVRHKWRYADEAEKLLND
jgi:hypothetical protein